MVCLSGAEVLWELELCAAQQRGGTEGQGKLRASLSIAAGKEGSTLGSAGKL